MLPRTSIASPRRRPVVNVPGLQDGHAPPGMDCGSLPSRRPEQATSESRASSPPYFHALSAGKGRMYPSFDVRILDALPGNGPLDG